MFKILYNAGQKKTGIEENVHYDFIYVKFKNR